MLFITAALPFFAGKHACWSGVAQSVESYVLFLNRAMIDLALLLCDSFGASEYVFP